MAAWFGCAVAAADWARHQHLPVAAAGDQLPAGQHRLHFVVKVAWLGQADRPG
jgi:hypothetical protein